MLLAAVVPRTGTFSSHCSFHLSVGGDKFKRLSVCNPTVFQSFFEGLFIFVAVCCIPVMLLAKPYILHKENRMRQLNGGANLVSKTRPADVGHFRAWPSRFCFLSPWCASRLCCSSSHSIFVSNTTDSRVTPWYMCLSFVLSFLLVRLVRLLITHPTIYSHGKLPVVFRPNPVRPPF